MNMLENKGTALAPEPQPKEKPSQSATTALSFEQPHERSLQTATTALSFEQQPRESAKAFAAFKTYLDLGAQRSLAATGLKLGKSERMMEKWSRRFDWPARAKAFAAHFASVERKAAEETAARYGADRATRRELEREDEWAMRTELMEAAREVLREFRDGERSATLGDVARALDIAAKLGRMSTGMPSVEKPDDDGRGPDVNVLVAIDLALDRVYGPEKGAPPPAPIVEVEVVPNKPLEGGKP
jgi:hypothetical protein